MPSRNAHAQQPSRTTPSRIRSIGGCVLYNALPVYAAMAGMMGALALANFFVLRAHWSYGNAA